MVARVGIAGLRIAVRRHRRPLSCVSVLVRGRVPPGAAAWRSAPLSKAIPIAPDVSPETRPLTILLGCDVPIRQDVADAGLPV
jgi:hypothetical protein